MLRKIIEKNWQKYTNSKNSNQSKVLAPYHYAWLQWNQITMNFAEISWDILERFVSCSCIEYLKYFLKDFTQAKYTTISIRYASLRKEYGFVTVDPGI